MRADREIVVVPIGGRLLPLRAPARRSGWGGAHLNRTSAANRGIEIAAAEEAQAGMIEIVALKVVDRGGIDAGAGIVGPADARGKQQVHIVEGISREDDEIGRLFDFLAGMEIDIDDAKNS